MSDEIRIELTNWKTVLVSPQDAERVRSAGMWFTSGRAGHVYACRRFGGRETVYMHRFIIGAKKGFEVDHINGDTLDNRRENLRLVSHQQNMRNRQAPRNNTSGYKGVYYHRGKWIARVIHDGKQIYIGSYTDIKEAAAARLNKEREIWSDEDRFKIEAASRE